MSDLEDKHPLKEESSEDVENALDNLVLNRELSELQREEQKEAEQGELLIREQMMRRRRQMEDRPFNVYLDGP